MELKFDEEYYKNEYLLFRYASALQSCKLQQKKANELGLKLVSLANELNFYAYPLILINNTSNNQIISSVKPNLTRENSEKLVLEMNQADTHYIDSIGISDVDKEAGNILETFNNFYKNGNFDKLNRACYRFLKRIKDVNEYDVNDAVIRYVVSCICLNDFNSSFNILQGVSQNYCLFDYNIYIFFLYLVSGQFEKAYEVVTLIKQNISENTFNLFTEEDLAFYLSLCLLLNFEVSNYKKVLSQNDTLVYLLYDKYPNLFEIVDDYYKCDYLKVNSLFEKIVKERILSDPLLAGYYNEIQNNFRKKTLKEILSFTSEIDYRSIKELLQVKDEATISKMIQDLILKENFPVIIDDIEGVVLAKEKKSVDELLEKSNENVRKKIKDLIRFSVQRGIKSNLNAKKCNGDNFKIMGRDFDMSELQMQ